MALNTQKQLWIVEDDEDLRYQLQGALQNAGYKVTAFFDGQPAIRHMQDYGLPHLAVIDIDLPRMDGFELSRELKSRGDVPIIFLTAKDKTRDIVSGLTEYGADDYITKPFDMDELLARIQRVLSRIANFDYVSTLPVTDIGHRLAVDFVNNRLLVKSEKCCQ